MQPIKIPKAQFPLSGTFFLLVVLALPLSSFGQRGPVLSLDTILQRIEAGNPLLQSYGLRAEALKESAMGATAWTPPMVGAGTFMTPYPFRKTMDPRDQGSLMIRAEQDIPNKSKQRARKAYLSSQADLQLAERSITLNDYRAEARRLYYSWLIIRQQISVLEENENIMTTMKKIEEVRYPYNQSELSSIYKITARIEQNRNRQRMQEAAITQIRATLNGLMNRAGEEPFSIDTSYAPEFQPVIADSGYLNAMRGDLIRIDADIRSLQLGIHSMELEKKPAFSIQFDHMQSFNRMMPAAFSVMGMLTIPIAPWSARSYRSEIRSMQLNIQAMEKEKAAALAESRGQLYGLQAQIQSSADRIQALENKVIPALQQSFEASFVSYQENKAKADATIEAWEALNTLQLDLLDEKLKRYQMIADYEKEIYR